MEKSFYRFFLTCYFITNYYISIYIKAVKKWDVHRINEKVTKEYEKEYELGE